MHQSPQSYRTSEKLAAIAGSRFGRIALPICAALFLWATLSWHLSLEWSVNEQYSYGFFVPFLAAYLFWVRWQERPEAEPQNSRKLSAILAACLGLIALLPLRLFEVANPDWRPLGWLHSFIVVGITLFALWFVGGKNWLRHFAFPLCFFLVAVPWITPIETPIIQGLQSAVAAIDAEIMALLGIPAQLNGNVIRLRTGLVGVNEACSGVRSLQTSIMAGLLFGEIHQMRWRRRIVLVLAVVALALFANVLRGAFLVMTAATHGLAAANAVHDRAGYFVLGSVIFGSFALAAWLQRGNIPHKAAPLQTAPRPHIHFPTSWVIATLCWLLLVEFSVESWYRMHEQGLISRPQWSARWLREPQGFRPVAIDEQTKEILRYDSGGGATWRNLENNVNLSLGSMSITPGASANWLLYFFRWEPGHASALRAKAHRPDICLPATGWRQTADLGVQLYAVSPELKLPFRHFEFEQPGSENAPNKGYAHAFYCVMEDKVPPQNRRAASEEVSGNIGGWARSDRLRMVLEGRRNTGQQEMEVIITTPGNLAAADAESSFAQALGRFVLPVPLPRK